MKTRLFVLILVSIFAACQAKRSPENKGDGNPPAKQVSKQGDKISFTTQKAPWNLVFTAKGFSIDKQDLKPDGSSGYFSMINDKTELTASLWIEPVGKCNTSKECRDMVSKAGNPAWGEFQDLVLSEIGSVSYFEFYRPSVQGQPVKMFDMYAEFVKDGYWVDLHMSKVLYKKEDHTLFEDLVNSASFESKK